MSRKNDGNLALSDYGPGTDPESYGKKRPNKTQTEIQFTNHLEGLFKDGVGDNRVSGGASGMTYGHSITAAVVYEKYDTALAELENLLELRKSYPQFGDQAGRYIQHGKTLIKAIKAKRSIGKLPHVSRAKQKELMNSLTFHFKELRACVINIEKIERSVRREDLSSTRWFITTLYWSVFSVFVAAMFIYVLPDTFMSFYKVFTHYVYSAMSYVVNLVI